MRNRANCIHGCPLLCRLFARQTGDFIVIFLNLRPDAPNRSLTEIKKAAGIELKCHMDFKVGRKTIQMDVNTAALLLLRLINKLLNDCYRFVKHHASAGLDDCTLLN